MDVGLRVELCFRSDRAIASLLSVSYFDLLTVQLMQMTYTAIHPLCRKVLKIRILGDSPDSGPLWKLPTALTTFCKQPTGASIYDVCSGLGEEGSPKACERNS